MTSQYNNLMLHFKNKSSASNTPISQFLKFSQFHVFLYRSYYKAKTEWKKTNFSGKKGSVSFSSHIQQLRDISEVSECTIYQTSERRHHSSLTQAMLSPAPSHDPDPKHFPVLYPVRVCISPLPCFIIQECIRTSVHEFNRDPQQCVLHKTPKNPRTVHCALITPLQKRAKFSSAFQKKRPRFVAF